MKMVKSLLLGSAAGLMAVAGAQAADMPVKAAPVEYVKICSLYGAGFYYIPGTDICVKIGGWVRFQAYSGNMNNGTSIFFAGAAGDQNTLLSPTATAGSAGGNDFSLRARATISMDSRAQTEWGTVRTYMNIGWTSNSGWYGVNLVNGSSAQGGECLYVNRGFIQWAGFTFGRAQSFYDFFPQSSFTYFGVPSGDTGDQATLLGAYTTQWGNGISTTIGIEESRLNGVLNTDVLRNVNGAAVAINAGSYFDLNFPLGGVVNNDAVEQRVPDVVGNFRIDQAWGSFQVMAALHDASAAYYTAEGLGTPTGICANGNSTSRGVVNLDCGHPGDKWGWAAGVGGTFNLPFIGKGDRFSFQVNTTEGATGYLLTHPNRGAPVWFGGQYSLGVGSAVDSVLRNTVNPAGAFNGQSGSLELTKGWGFEVAFEHFWTPSLRTSWYGGGYQIDYNSNATSYICHKTALASTPWDAPIADNPLCNPDHGVWFVGTRTQWNIRPDFYMGVDLLYSKLETANDGAYAAINAVGARPGSLTTVTTATIPAGGGATSTVSRIGQNYLLDDQDALALTFRVQRDIVP